MATISSVYGTNQEPKVVLYGFVPVSGGTYMNFKLLRGTYTVVSETQIASAQFGEGFTLAAYYTLEETGTQTWTLQCQAQATGSVRRVMMAFI